MESNHYIFMKRGKCEGGRKEGKQRGGKKGKRERISIIENDFNLGRLFFLAGNFLSLDGGVNST